MDFKKLKPIPLRPECEPDYEQQIWQPTWCCFCCHDTGFVTDRLAALVIEGYTSGQHKIARCRASKCQAAAILILKIPREKEMRIAFLFAIEFREQKPLSKRRVN